MAADPTGTIHETFDGSARALRLTMAGLARVQQDHGSAVAALLNGVEVSPSLSMCLMLVSVALQKGERMSAAEADELADEMFTADPAILERLLTAAFPETKSGNVPASPNAGT